MLKKGPLWAIYTASYFIDYVLILGILMYRKISVVTSVTSLLKSITLKNWITGSILALLIIFSVFVMVRIRKIKMTIRIKHEPKDDVVWEVYTGFFAPALALAGTFFGDYGMIFSLVVFMVTGIEFVRSKQVHLASVFIFPLCYRIFKADNAVLITRDSRDGLRLRIEEELDGVEAKELAPMIYLVN